MRDNLAPTLRRMPGPRSQEGRLWAGAPASTRRGKGQPGRGEGTTSSSTPWADTTECSGGAVTRARTSRRTGPSRHPQGARSAAG